ncbi:MAG: MBL fold metallo-hydrolase [Acidimicrobiales bacterium]|nr:MBL fold metallo-hydrolase [Acidimicrobiales bacterium]
MGLREIAEAVWTGDEPASSWLAGNGRELHEVDDGVALVLCFGNVMPVATGEGLVLIDTSTVFAAPTIHATVRTWSADLVHTVVYTHGHLDHVGGVGPFEQERVDRGESPLRVIAHQAVPERFDRYKLTRGYNSVINQRQFSLPGFTFPDEWRYPDLTYRTNLEFEVGGVNFSLHHARGETDDHTWVYLPQRRILFPGDLFIWCVPNAGNPQKVQRYAADWAAALRSMAQLGAEIMVPSHGIPVFGADRVRAALEDSAELLEALHRDTLAMMNEGARLNDILHAVKPPEHLLGKPYLRPMYDDPEFIVRNIWRLYGGWFDGNPAELKPAPTAALARELARLAGGARVLADRARELAAAGDLRLAGHLAEFAVGAAPDDPQIHAVRAEVFAARCQEEPSLMAKGIFGAAARESAERSRG